MRKYAKTFLCHISFRCVCAHLPLAAGEYVGPQTLNLPRVTQSPRFSPPLFPATIAEGPSASSRHSILDGQARDDFVSEGGGVTHISAPLPDMGNCMRALTNGTLPVVPTHAISSLLRPARSCPITCPNLRAPKQERKRFYIAASTSAYAVLQHVAHRAFSLLTRRNPNVRFPPRFPPNGLVVLNPEPSSF